MTISGLGAGSLAGQTGRPKGPAQGKEDFSDLLTAQSGSENMLSFVAGMLGQGASESACSRAGQVIQGEGAATDATGAFSAKFSDSTSPASSLGEVAGRIGSPVFSDGETAVRQSESVFSTDMMGRSLKAGAQNVSGLEGILPQPGRHSSQDGAGALSGKTGLEGILSQPGRHSSQEGAGALSGRTSLEGVSAGKGSGDASGSVTGKESISPAVDGSVEKNGVLVAHDRIVEPGKIRPDAGRAELSVREELYGVLSDKSREFAGSVALKPDGQRMDPVAGVGMMNELVLPSEKNGFQRGPSYSGTRQGPGAAPSAGSAMEHHLSGLFLDAPAQQGKGSEAVVTASGARVPVMDVVNQLASQVPVSGNIASQRLTLQLHPKELGPVTLHVSVQKDRVHARIEAGSEQVLEVLGRHLPRLQTAMAEQNVAFSGMDLSLGADQHQEQQQKNGHNEFSSFTGGNSDEGHVEEPRSDDILTLHKNTSDLKDSSGLSVRV